MKIFVLISVLCGLSALIMSVLVVLFIYSTSGWQYSFLLASLWAIGPLFLTMAIAAIAAEFLVFFPKFDIRRRDTRA